MNNDTTNPTTTSDNASEARETDQMTLIYLNPNELTIGTNVRLDPRLDAEFIASIKTRGVLQPIVAVRHDDGAHVVRYGQRRTLAAVAAKRDAIPVFLVNDTDDAARLIDQMTENDHRQGLTPAERLAGFEQLAVLGMTAAQIAKQTATDRDQVKAALKVAKNATATAAVTNHAVSFTEAVVLGEFEDDPAATQRLTRELGTGQFEHLAQRLRDARAEQQRIEKYAAQLRADGTTVLTTRPTYTEAIKPFHRLRLNGADVSDADQLACPDLALLVITSRGWVDAVDATPIAVLNSPDTENLDDIGWHDADKHWNRIDRSTGPDGPAEATGKDCATDSPGQDEDADEQDDDEAPAYAAAYDDEEEEEESERLVHDDGTRAVWGEYLDTERWCMNPAAHGYTDGFGYTVPASTQRKKAADMEPVERAAVSAARRDVIDSNKAWTSAETVRRTWLRTFLTRKTPPKGTGQFLAVAMLTDLSQLDASNARSQATVSLSLSDTPDYVGRDLLRKAADKTMTDPRGTVVALGVVLSAYEASTHKGSWRKVDDGTRRYLEFLAANGYTLAPVEQRACGHETDPADSEAADVNAESNEAHDVDDAHDSDTAEDEADPAAQE
ncbi:MAG: ParB/RepB/Spo0J family partition protein [Janthinobacterium lividum]